MSTVTAIKATGITDRSFSDFAEVLIMNKPAQTLTGGIVGFIGHVNCWYNVWCAVCLHYLVNFA